MNRSPATCPTISDPDRPGAGTIGTPHGVLLQVHGEGLLVTGPPGVGKSALAWTLVDRGHQLVVDDAPRLTGGTSDDGTGCVFGHAPARWRGLLAVRGIGLLDLRRQYGPRATLPCCRISRVLELVPAGHWPWDDPEGILGVSDPVRLLDISLPAWRIPALGALQSALAAEAICRGAIIAPPDEADGEPYRGATLSPE
ncbi:MAG: HPr kinase/phosphorylase [Halothiobacillaceae bacterium]